MVAVVIALAIIISSLVAYQLNKTYYIGYSESGSIDYNVFLEDNEFYDSTFLDKDQSYVASLIDKIVADFSYNIEMDTSDVNYKYSYTVKSRLEIIDNSSKAPIFNPEYELVSVQNKTKSSSSRLHINEIVVLDYDQYNDLANKFLATYDLTGNTTSNIVVTLSVDVLSDCNAFSGSTVDAYTSELRIPLTTKTVNIKMTSAVPDSESKMIACTRGAGYEAFKTTAIVLGVFEALVLLLMGAFIYLTRTEDITYTARVKKIVSQYKSYIQRIKTIFDHSGYQRVFVDTFDEMLEIRDTIQAPILMYENNDKTCAKFMIPTDSKLLYIYEIKIEGFEEPETESSSGNSQTAVPNITNVVRPVVKVVVNPAAPKADAPMYETVIEAPEVEADGDVEVVASADDFEEQDGFASIAEAVDAAEEIIEDEVPEDEIPDDVTANEIPEAVSEEIPENNTSEGGIAPCECGSVACTVVPTVVESIDADGEDDDGLDEDKDLTTVIDGRMVQFRYRKSFKAKLIQSDDRIKSFYIAVRQRLLSYKGVKARTSWSFESCNRGRIQCAKLNIKGKTMLVYLHLNTENYNVNKYHFRDVGDKAKFSEVPMLLKVKSDRGLKYVLELIDEMMNVLEIPLGKIQDTDYVIPYQTTEELIEEGLIKVVYPYEGILDEDFKPDASDVDPEVESFLSSIPEVDEKATVDAIDVCLDSGSGMTERYDPDGNDLSEGDIVLVSARDKATNRNMVCEAEVARGNYKVDADTLDGPLKKIIGVVRRKAKQIFTAMITPVDEDKD